MHQLISGNINSVKMTSRDMAELTEKRHDNIKRTIETLANSGVISYPQIEDGAKAANGVVEKIYVFSGEQGKLALLLGRDIQPEFSFNGAA